MVKMWEIFLYLREINAPLFYIWESNVKKNETMTKAEILKRMKEKQAELYNEFIDFTKNEGFIETIDKVGNFPSKTHVFFKKISENHYLVFNIPPFGNIKKYGFCADLWKVIAKSESEFINSKLENKNLIDLRLGFNLERDLNLYNETLSNY
jgi:hypothetical protein